MSWESIAMATTTIDEETIKSRQQATWSSGDYSVIGTTLQITGEMLCEAVDVGAGERVLDVAAGNGNAALAAARRGASVTATDYVPELLGRARVRAAAEGLKLDVREGDAESLPFAGATFDVVLSTFGVMFTPNPERAASELLRVCRPGGRIGLASWTPDGFVGEMFTIVGRYLPPPAGARSPLEWGSDARVRELFGSRVRALTMQRRDFVFRYRSPEHWLDAFRSYYGPIHKAFASLDRAGQGAFARDLLGLARRYDTGRNGAFRASSAYLQAVAVKVG
jgi:SAM-dependent methyltransferase